MLTERKLVVVTRRTRYQELLHKYGTRGQAEFYLRHLGESFGHYEQEHLQLCAAYESVLETARAVGRVQPLERELLPSYRFAPDDIVIVAGQDGLVANTLKYLDAQPVIAVNPLPRAFDGLLLPFAPKDLAGVLRRQLQSRFRVKTITMAQVSTNRGERLLAVNDLFIGSAGHASARYALHSGARQEQQSSSGVIVSTGLGSTGWLRSILTGASAVAGQEAHPELKDGFAWDSNFLCYSVREPFPSKTTGTSLVFGRVDAQTPLRLQSRMAERGVIFSDGIESDFIDFTAGTVAEIRISDKTGRLVV